MTIEEVDGDLCLPSNKQSNQTTNSSNELKLGEHDYKMAIVLSLVVKEDFIWSVNVHGVDVDGKCCPSISQYSNPLLPVNVNQFIECLDKLNVCPGHPNSHFIEFAMAKRKFTFANGKVTAILDSASEIKNQ